MIANNWFKLWTDILIDVKMCSLDHATFRAWILCLNLAAEMDDQGRLPDDDQIAWSMYMHQLRADEWEAARDELQKRKMLARKNGVLYVVNFVRRQGKDYAAKMRKSRYRGRKGNAPRDASGTPKGTPRGPRRGEERRKEEEREEKERKENEKSAREKARPGSVEDVSTYMQEWASKEGHRINPNLQAQKFMNHFQTNGWLVGKAKNKMKDWEAAARNWILNIEEINGKRTDKPPRRDLKPGVGEELDFRR